MRPSRTSWLAAAAVVAALLPGATPLPAHAVYCDIGDSICQALSDAQVQQAAAQAQLEQIQHKLKDVQAQAQQLAILLQQLDSQIQQQQAQIDHTQGQLDQLDQGIRLTEADIARREAHIKVREQLLDQRVRAMDKHGSVNYFQLFVTSTSFNQLLDRVVIMQDIVRSDRQLLDDLRVEHDQVQNLRDNLKVQRDQQAALLKQQQDQKAQLEASRKTQAEAFAFEQSLEAQYEQQRRELEAQKAVIDGQVQQLTSQYNAEATAAGGGTGQFGWPERTHLITQGFGCSWLLGEPYDPRCPSRHTHTGIDIGGPFGAPIYATDAGVAHTFSGWGGGYGNYIIVIHGSGYSTFYAHQSRFAVGSGAVVQRGQVIGYEGSTGYSTGPHLHFEIRYNNVAQNPCTYIGC